MYPLWFVKYVVLNFHEEGMQLYFTFRCSQYTQPSNKITLIIVDTYDMILDDIQNKKRDRETFREITSSLE